MSAKHDALYRLALLARCQQEWLPERQGTMGQCALLWLPWRGCQQGSGVGAIRALAAPKIHQLPRPCLSRSTMDISLI